MSLIAENLRLLRKQKKLTQEELSSKLGYTSCQFISNIERGISSIPLKAVEKYATALGIEAKVLFEFLGKDRQNKVLSYCNLTENKQVTFLDQDPILTNFIEKYNKQSIEKQKQIKNILNALFIE